MHASGALLAMRSRGIWWLASAVVVVAVAASWLVQQREAGAPPPIETPPAPFTPASSIVVDAVRVPLNPQDPSQTTIGDFHYAGGLWLTSPTSDKLHELSDITFTGTDRLAAVGDAGVLFAARLLFDSARQLSGADDAMISNLVGPDGKPLAGDAADAEGFTTLSNGDRLVGFERIPRVLLYPAAGGLPREVSAPQAALPFNAGIEALTADPDSAPDAYVVGAEESGETWRCRVSAPCVKGPTLEKPQEFGLVGMRWLPDGRMAYLLRAYDPAQGTRISLRIVRGETTIARLDLAPPLTVDNFEAVTSVTEPDGHIRFFIASDDNGSATQRTLLLAFDWRPR